MPEPTELNCCPDGTHVQSKALIKVRDRKTQTHETFHLLLPDATWATLIAAMQETLPYVLWHRESAEFVWQDDF